VPILKKVNKSFFKKWTPEMAYVLGFFFADGSYDVNPRGSEYFSFQITDKQLLYRIRDVLESNHKIAVRSPRTENDNIQYRLQIGSKEMCKDLKKLGISQNKSTTAVFPEVPRKYVGAFIHGYFDGDGNVWSGLTHRKRKVQGVTLLAAFTSCSKKFLVGLQNENCKHGIGNGSLFKLKNNNAFRLQYSAKDSIILFNLMYGKSIQNGLVLQRKKIVFDNFLVKRNKLRSVSESFLPTVSKNIKVN
jgi:hypothetical protein